ncbi:MAG: ABC transporter permease [Firmicutes bacterium]|nr:ABC transporter permease [Bacillota bacterium]
MQQLIKKHCINVYNALKRPLISVFLALLVGAIILLISGENPLTVYKVLVYGAFVGRGAILNTLFTATPLILAGLACIIAFRTDIFNIGVEGQIYMGAFAAAFVGFTFTGLPGYIHIPLCFLAAIIAGGLWGAVPGLLKGFLGVNELVVTIMLNQVATLFTGYLVTHPFRGEGLGYAASPKIADSAFLPRFKLTSQLHFGFIIALLMVILVYFYFRHMSLGFESRIIGWNRLFAETAGMDVAKKTVWIMIISGAVAGVAGAGEVLGVHHRFAQDFSPGYGFDGVTIALLGRNHPVGVLIAALFFAVLRSGSSMMEMMTSISSNIIKVLQSVIIFFLAVEFLFRETPIIEYIKSIFQRIPKGEGAIWRN